MKYDDHALMYDDGRRSRARWAMRKIAKGFLIGFGAGLGLILVTISAPKAHTAPSGWSYPSDCCSTTDCFPISEKDVTPTPVGWRIEATGELIEYHDKRVRPSGDGQYHRCSTGGDPKAETLCLFVPGSA